MKKENTISVQQLQVGVYVLLDMSWMEHPFSFSSFKIRTQDQLDTIRQLGLDSVRWDPARSDAKPLANSASATPPGTATPVVLDTALMEAKRTRMARLTEHREKLASTEKAFASAASVIRNINKTIYSQPGKTLAEAAQLVGQVVNELLAAPDVAIQAMTEKPGNEDLYFHSLNVSILSMIIGRELKLPVDVVRMIGLGAIFHDIGLNEIPAKIANNPGMPTKVERDFRNLHCQYGYEIGKKAGLPQAALNIIYQHHEHFDGSGFPRQIKGEAIDLLARLVALVNAYDKLCNPVNIAHALTPHEALSQMFAQQRSRFDPKLLQAFIRFMGVYPPGTLVGLSNDALGLVIRVNSAKPLRPTVIIYDPAIPKTEALLVSLQEEADISITRAIRPSQLPPAAFDYLSPRRRVSYYFDASQPDSSK